MGAAAAWPRPSPAQSSGGLPPLWVASRRSSWGAQRAPRPQAPAPGGREALGAAPWAWGARAPAPPGRGCQPGSSPPSGWSGWGCTDNASAFSYGFQLLSTLLLCLSNLMFIPPVAIAVRSNYLLEAAVYIFTMFFSTVSGGGGATAHPTPSCQHFGGGAGLSDEMAPPQGPSPSLKSATCLCRPPSLAQQPPGHAPEPSPPKQWTQEQQRGLGAGLAAHRAYHPVGEAANHKPHLGIPHQGSKGTALPAVAMQRPPLTLEVACG